MQAFHLIGSMTCRTSSLEKNSRVQIDGNLMMTRVTVIEQLRGWQVDDNGVLLQGQVDDIRFVHFKISHVV